jgi:WD40 repeat protein
MVRLRGHLGEAWSAAISPDGRMLASGSSEGTLRLWDATTRREGRMHPGCGVIVGFSADGRLLVGRGIEDCRLLRLADGDVRTVPLDNYVLRRRDHSADVHGIEPYAVFGMGNGVLEHWNLAAMSRVASWRVSQTAVATAALSPDGKFIAIGDVNGVLTLWEAATHREIRQFKSGERLECMAFSPDGRLLAGSKHNDRPSAATLAETAASERVRIWDVHDGSLLRELNAHNGITNSLAFSPDGKLLVTAHEDNTAQLWEIPSGNRKATLKGHVHPVMGVAFSPDGKTLATGGGDSKVKLWNTATEQELATLEPLPGGCMTLRFSPDGRTLAAGSYLGPEQYMSLWQVPSFEEIDASEATLKTANKQP